MGRGTVAHATAEFRSHEGMVACKLQHAANLMLLQLLPDPSQVLSTQQKSHMQNMQFAPAKTPWASSTSRPGARTKRELCVARQLGALQKIEKNPHSSAPYNILAGMGRAQMFVHVCNALVYFSSLSTPQRTYQLSIRPRAAGRVNGAGLSCGPLCPQA